MNCCAVHMRPLPPSPGRPVSAVRRKFLLHRPCHKKSSGRILSGRSFSFAGDGTSPEFIHCYTVMVIQSCTELYFSLCR